MSKEYATELEAPTRTITAATHRLFKRATRVVFPGLALTATLFAFGAVVAPCAQADIIVVKQHNSIDAFAQVDYQTFGRRRIVVDHPATSDTLTSFFGSVNAGAHYGVAGGGSQASLSTTILNKSLAITGTIAASATSNSTLYELGTSSSSAVTIVQFKVTTSGYYSIGATAGGSATVQLLANGAVVFSTNGTVQAPYHLTAGPTYEIDATANLSRRTGTYSSAASYTVSVTPAG